MNVKWLSGVLFWAVLAVGPLHAQTKARTVYVDLGSSHTTFEKQVIAGIKARIGGTSRYVVGDKNSELFISVLCLDGTSLAHVNGGVCSFVMTYFSSTFGGLSSDLRGVGMLSDPDASEIAEEVFQKFVEASSENKLIDIVAEMESQVKFHNTIHPCSQP